MPAPAPLESIPLSTTLSTTSSTADRASHLLRAGRVIDALDALDALVPADDLERARMTATELDCRLAHGDLAAAHVLGGRLGPLLDAERGTGSEAAAVSSHARGELASALGDPEHAATHFLTAGDLLDDDRPEHAAELPWRAGAALALVRTGRRREAAELASDHLGVARASGSPYAVATALRTLATVDPGTARATLLRRARAALDGVVAERLAAQLDTDLAGQLLLTPTPDAAREALVLLRSAEEYAGRERLGPLQSRVQRLLDRLGEPSQTVRRDAVTALTASERRVARLAAGGRTNRQIAEELVVTVKAVEWHLSHVYRKLGITSRRRLPTALGAFPRAL